MCIPTVVFGSLVAKGRSMTKRLSGVPRRAGKLAFAWVITEHKLPRWPSGAREGGAAWFCGQLTSDIFRPPGAPQTCWRSLAGTFQAQNPYRPSPPACPSPGLATGTRSRHRPAAACLTPLPKPAVSRARTGSTR